MHGGLIAWHVFAGNQQQLQCCVVIRAISSMYMALFAIFTATMSAAIRYGLGHW